MENNIKSENKYKCQYCGKLKCGLRSDNKPYDLCWECHELYKDGKIIKCPHCNGYIKVEERNTMFTAEQIKIDKRKTWTAPIRCKDGHYVRSKGEQLIDEWLYSEKIAHCYEQKNKSAFQLRG